MPYYAQYDPSVPGPSKVTGWYNTTARAYPNLPATSDLLEITETEWQAHYTNADGWAVSDGALVPYTPPPPVLTLAQQARNAATSGLTITLSGTMTLAATLFPTDTVTQRKLGAVVTTLLATGDFPGGASSYPMLDATGSWHTFSPGQYKSVAGAIASYVAACDLIAAGNPLGAADLPANSVSLIV
jgi:hypothetical protein